MPKRDQHYVPQFYLRFFSSEASPRTISLYSLRSDSLIHGASIRDQCARPWFYGKDEVIEEGLAQIEAATSAVLHRIRADRRLAPTDTPDHGLLLLFAAVQGLRTNRVMQEGLDQERKVSALVFHGDQEAEARFFGGPPPYIPPNFRLSLAMIIAQSYADLSALIVAAPRHHGFLTSDHPVALYNQLLQEYSSNRGTTGAAASGLQIFLPLSPNLCVLLFDPDVYYVPPRRRSGPIRATENDLAQINLLQVLEAENCLYFHPATDEHLIRQAVVRGKPLRGTVGPRVVEAVSEEDERRSLLHEYRATANMNLGLSFLRLSRFARQADYSDSLVRYRPAAAAVIKAQMPTFGSAPSRLRGTFHVRARL